MHFSRFAVLLVAAVSLACGSGSSSSDGNGGSGSGGGGSGSGSSGGNGSSGGSGGSSSSGGSGSGGSSGAGSSGGSGGSTSSSSSGGSSSGGNPDAGVSDQSVTLTMGPFTVPGGSEVYKCQTFANPFGGKDVDVKEYQEHMTEGSHHMFVFFSPGATDGAIQDCSGIEFHAYPFSAQSPDATFTYPPTVGSHIPASMGFELNAHFVNATATAFQATLTVTFHLALPGAVTQYAGTVFMNNYGISIPPGQTPVTVTRTHTMPQDMYVIESSSHMHQRATDFVATSGSQQLYTTQSWSSPMPALYNPPVHLTSGSPVTWSCTYVNDTGQTLIFGESAQTNVMCIYTMQFYPVADPTNPTIDIEVQ
jgi:hypothetical protein